MKPTRLLILVQHLRPGGIESLALDFLAHMPDCKTLLVSMEGNRKDALNDWPRLRPHAENIAWLDKKPGWDLNCFDGLYNIARHFQPDIIHSHHIGPLIYGGVAAKLTGAKLVHTEHDAWHLDSPKRRILQKLSLSLFKPTVIADAEMVAEKFQKALNKKTDHVIINGVDTNHFHPMNKKVSRTIFNLPMEKTVIGVAGRLVPVKRIDDLVVAFALSSRKDLHLAIAGTGPMQTDIEDLILLYGLQDQVSLLGHVEDMPHFYNALDNFILPSAREGLPLSLLEAQACGVRAIATDVGGTSEAICPDTGALIYNTDLESLVDFIAHLDRPHFSTPSPRDFVNKIGSREGMFDQYLTAYKGALS